MATPGYRSYQEMQGNKGNFNNGSYGNDGSQRIYGNHGNIDDPYRNNGSFGNQGNHGSINDPYRNNGNHQDNYEHRDNRDEYNQIRPRGGRSPRADKHDQQRTYDNFVTRDYDTQSPDHRQENRRRGVGDYVDREQNSVRRSGGGGNERRRSRSRSRSRDRSYSRSSRNRSRSRERRRDRSADYRRGDRDSSRDRTSSRYGRDGRDDRDNRENRDNRDNRDSDYRRSSSSVASRDERYQRDEFPRSERGGGGGSSSKHELLQPSSTVIIQSLHLEAQEKDIEALLTEDGFVARSVAVIRERNSESRGFAFVDFENETVAKDWIVKRQQSLVILGQKSVLNYSRNKRQQQQSNTSQQNPQHIPDWTCNKCKMLNFGSRQRFGEPFVCFKCSTVRDESEISRQDQQNSSLTTPCNVLMIRGMDFSTEEEKIRIEIVKLTSKVLYDVRLIRDKVTDMSRGFAFVELGTTEDAKELLETIECMEPSFEIDGRRITVGYARNGYNAPLGGKKTMNTLVSKETAAQNAVAQATAASSNKTIAEYTSHNVTGTLPTTSSTGTADGLSASAALASQGFTYDTSSGYYYDSNSGLYYDSSTGYYYNSTTEQWLQWDGTQYNVINQDGSVVDQTQQQTPQQQQQLAPDLKQQPPPPPPTQQYSSAGGQTRKIQQQQQQQQQYPQQPQQQSQQYTQQYNQQQQQQQPLSKTISTPAQNALMIASDQQKNQQPYGATPGEQASGVETVQMGGQKPKSARKIAKDMERWAKKLNTQSETKKAAVKQAQQELRMLEQKEEELRKKITMEKSITDNLETIVAAKDGVRSLFVPDNDEEGSVLKLGSALSQSNSQKLHTSLVADYPDDDFADDYVIDESQLVDLSKMACLLCQRQLTSQENLTKHLQMSTLHKQNLEKYKRIKQSKR